MRNRKLLQSTDWTRIREWAGAVAVMVEKAPLITNGKALVGIAFMLSGILVGREGVLRLMALWNELAPFFPFSITDNVAQRISVSLPLILRIFVSAVSSICAVLVGALWLLSGVVEAVQSRAPATSAGDFDDSPLVAESLRTAAPMGWRSVPWLARMTGFFWPATLFMNPVSYEHFRDLVRSLWKLFILGVAIALVTYVLQVIPLLLKGFFQRDFVLIVPSARSLYFLLGFVLLADVLMAFSLVPFRRRRFRRSSQEFSVKGGGDPHVLFALLEEGCRLLTPKGAAGRLPTRMRDRGDARIKATLVENFPARVRALGRPAAYVCLPLMVVFLAVGFSRLVNFNPRTATMIYTDFISYHLLEYVLETAFSFGMILCGLHFAEWARRLFGVCTFRSSLVFCTVAIEEPPGAAGRPPGVGPKDGRDAPVMDWTVTRDVDEHFAGWARQPESENRLHMEVWWGQAISEAADADAPRQLTSVTQSDALDNAMQRILELPFHVDFEIDEPVESVLEDKTSGDRGSGDSRE